MISERVQLHSTLGRQLLLAQSYLPWLAISGGLSSVVVAAARGGIGAGQLSALVFMIPFIHLARWARRNSTPVFATPQGLELSKPGHTVPWASVVRAWRIPFSGLMAVQRVTFSDGTPPLTFYCSEDLELIVQRFNSAPPQTLAANRQPAP